MTRHFIAAFSEDIRIRTEGLEREVPGGYRVRIQGIRAGGFNGTVSVGKDLERY